MELDEYQKIACRTEENRVLVVAPPGSGKTTVLLERLGLTIGFRRSNPAGYWY